MEGIEGAAVGYSGSRVQWHIVVWMGWPSKHPKLEPQSVATLSPELRSMQIHRHTRGVQMSISYRSKRDPAYLGANAYFVTANVLTYLM